MKNKKRKMVSFEVNEAFLGKDLHLRTNIIHTADFDNPISYTEWQHLFCIAKCEMAEFDSFEDIDENEVGDEIIERVIVAKINGQCYSVTEFYQWGGVETSHPQLVY